MPIWILKFLAIGKSLGRWSQWLLIGCVVLFVYGVFQTIHGQKLQLADFKATNQRLTDLVERREETLEQMSADIRRQREITETQLAKEQESRDKANEQIDTIRELLKNNACATTAVPDGVLNELHK